jgi:hypothetical protein
MCSTGPRLGTIDLAARLHDIFYTQHARGIPGTRDLYRNALDTRIASQEQVDETVAVDSQ